MKILIQKMIINKKKEILLNMNRSIIYAILPIIDWSILPDTPTGFHKFLLGILGLSIILLWCFINVIGYFIVLYGIKYINLEVKYPKLKRVINYFYNMNYIFIIIEIIYILVILITVIVICILLLYEM